MNWSYFIFEVLTISNPCYFFSLKHLTKTLHNRPSRLFTTKWKEKKNHFVFNHQTNWPISPGASLSACFSLFRRSTTLIQALWRKTIALLCLPFQLFSFSWLFYFEVASYISAVFCSQSISAQIKQWRINNFPFF